MRPLAAAPPTARAGRIAAPQAPPLAPAWREPPPVIRLRPGGDFRHDLLPGLPALSGFPFEVWRRLAAKALRQLARGPAFYAEPEGRPALRAAIAGHVSFVRGIACRAEDVLVTAGAQQAFDLLARVLVEPGRSVVAVEEPGYPPLRRALAAAGAVLAPVPVDAQGLIVEQLPPAARLVCVSPSHQFPMGRRCRCRAAWPCWSSRGATTR
ncbi:aminotransferase class I/II-fold pyridoxal phosphate-dependent enzyme [Roseateles sp. DAIF2]|uniref:aminotransferase class I/II-fold pyridoxal phosphate-dependent enzyme n=1 Tax=Roseateles sp. DAIF2 TaxID=2714952 RepID=UPI0021116192|nr:aminotransferase class I/II-fold pyridoxal phosphate-dependent enzyme [Roseateles sp. DAIF2]